VYGYGNVREGKGKTVRVVNEPEAAVVRRIFDLAGKGHGLKRIVNVLNAKNAPVPGPRYACTPADRSHEHSDACPRQSWEVSGVREILYRDLYRGIGVFGKTKRVREGGTKGKVWRPESEWKRVERPDLRIVTDEQWKAAHTAIAATNAVFLCKNGRLQGKPEQGRGTAMLTGFLQCGLCGGRMTAMVRGRKNERQYVCRTHLGRGNDVCSNTTGVPALRLHAAVVAALRDTFTEENFQAHLAKLADDEHARQARADERGRLLASIPEMAAEEQRLARAIAQGVALDAVVAELKAVQAERDAAEARVQELETMDRELKTQAELVEQLRGTIRAGTMRWRATRSWPARCCGRSSPPDHGRSARSWGVVLRRLLLVRRAANGPDRAGRDLLGEVGEPRGD
jgi:site-specific DNA recombinase